MFITSTPTSNDIVRFATESAPASDMLAPLAIGIVLTVFLFGGLISAVIAQHRSIQERYNDIVRF